MPRREHSSRRQFLKKSAVVAVGGIATPYVIPSGVLAGPDGPGANERIGIGWIGTGRRAHQMIGDLKGTHSLPAECRVVAVSDVWPKKCHEYLKVYEEQVLGPKGGKTGAKYGIYRDYREMLESPDIDAVVLTTPEHSRALPCILACQAGKDVYAEKPLSLTVREGRAMVQAVRKHNRVCQVGTQQRSMLRNREASELIRNGRLGKLESVLCQNWAGSRPYRDFTLPTEPVPDDLDWNHWCGQTEPVPFSTHVYLTYNNPGWHNIRRYSGGGTTNAGSHSLDVVQWALGTETTGPVEVEPHGKEYNSEVTFRYASGVLLKLTNQITEKDVSAFGAIFVGERGRLVMHRGRFNTNPIAISQEPLGENDTRLVKSDHHFQNWIDCIQSRQPPVADIEFGHRACTICHLANIARWVGRKLKWDPEQERFPDDDQANALLSRPQREGYRLPDTVS
ncbi:MAG: Gfo/Idh/MocA family oxidoreductase [Candidatus Anammoximicrobium sp.]|nr:Gfo/Idh/MocA family oxidoreductase [Candidatus Anammoximicrobium sp.]